MFALTELSEEYWFVCRLPPPDTTCQCARRSELPLTAETCRSSVFYLLPVVKIEPSCQAPASLFSSFSQSAGCSSSPGHHRPLREPHQAQQHLPFPHLFLHASLTARQRKTQNQTKRHEALRKKPLSVASSSFIKLSVSSVESEAEIITISG